MRIGSGLIHVYTSVAQQGLAKSKHSRELGKMEVSAQAVRGFILLQVKARRSSCTWHADPSFGPVLSFASSSNLLWSVLPLCGWEIRRSSSVGPSVE